MSGSDRLWFRANESFCEWVADYAEQEHDGNESEALRTLVERGLEAEASPVSRWRGATRNACAQLVFVAITVVVVGYGTEAIRPIPAVQVAALLIALSASVLAGLELAERATAPDVSVSRDGETA